MGHSLCQALQLPLVENAEEVPRSDTWVRLVREGPHAWAVDNAKEFGRGVGACLGG